MTSTLKFNNWQDAAGNAVFDTSNGGIPVSGNAIINGDFDIWQRGTSFTSASDTYTADRWSMTWNGASGTATQQSFTPADIEATGYGDAEFFLRIDSSGGNTTQCRFEHRIEDVRTFAGQQVTLSFWAKQASSSTHTVQILQDFGSGGSSDVLVQAENLTIGTTWQRYSVTVDVDSVSGKTIGSGSYLFVRFLRLADEAFTLDLWGVQLEAGSVATSFKLAGGGSKAAELALCQRYFETGDHRIRVVGGGSTTIGYQQQFTVTKRTSPSLSTTPDLGTVVSSSANSTSIYISYTSLVSGNGACSYEADAEL